MRFKSLLIKNQIHSFVSYLFFSLLYIESLNAGPEFRVSDLADRRDLADRLASERCYLRGIPSFILKKFSAFKDL